MAAREKPPLEERVLHFARQHRLLPQGQPVVVAVSGGPDSVCLLHILSTIREELGITLHAAHLNHQLRGADADADAEYVSALSRRLGIPVTVERRNVRAFRARHHLSLEEAAREVRYAFLAKVAGSLGADRVAVGHTVDDHLETVLMHLIRGTGTRGLRGLQPVTVRRLAAKSITIIRPLLQISREDTADYCARNNLAPRADASNLALSPLRNRIRHELLPLLRRYNPGIAQALFRTARIAGDDIAFLEEQAAQAWGDIARIRENTVVLDKTRFLKLPSTLQRYLLRTAIEKLAGNIMDIEARHIDGIMSALARPAGRRVNLPSGLTFATGYDEFLLGRDPAALSPYPALDTEIPLKIPGETRMSGWQVKAAIITSEEMAKSGGLTACFDLDKTGDELTVRCRRQGDRFQPLGMSQPKKLGEFMIDARVPRSWRNCVPLVCSPQHIIWAVDWRIDDRVKVTGTTSRVLRLEFEQTGSINLKHRAL